MAGTATVESYSSLLMMPLNGMPWQKGCHGRIGTSPEDLAVWLSPVSLPLIGGMTSHAAVVARGMERSAVYPALVP